MNSPPLRSDGVLPERPVPESVECGSCAGLGLAFRGRDERTGKRVILLCGRCSGTGIRILRSIPASGAPPVYAAPAV